MKISVVIPVFNSEKTISQLISRIENALKNFDYEIICVDDLSTDRSWIELGDIIVTLDDDLQNPPEEIVKLIEEYRNGYDLVYGSYREKNIIYLED